jgi:hypothetical protein
MTTNKTTEETTTANSGFASGGGNGFVRKFCAKNPPERKAANRYGRKL